MLVVHIIICERLVYKVNGIQWLVIRFWCVDGMYNNNYVKWLVYKVMAELVIPLWPALAITQ